MVEKILPTYPKESKWTILQVEENGHPMFVRRNESAKQLMEHKDYSYRVGFAIPLRNPNSEGLPSNEEMGMLNSIEDILSKEIEKDENFLLVLVVSTDGMGESLCTTQNALTLLSRR